MARAPRTAAGDDGPRSIHRAIAVLRAVAAGQWAGMRLSDVAAGTGLSVGTTHRLLAALLREGAIERTPRTRRYRIGPEVPLLALARGSGTRMVAVAAPHLEALSAACGDSVYLSVRHRLDSVCIDRRTSNVEPKLLAVDVGARRPLGFGVSGLVLLASLPDADAAAILARNAVRLAPHGIIPDEALSRVRLARTQGYAYGDRGVVRGIRALSVPVPGGGGPALAAISIGAVADRLPHGRVKELASRLSAEAARLARRFAVTLGDDPW